METGCTSSSEPQQLGHKHCLFSASYMKAKKLSWWWGCAADMVDKKKIRASSNVFVFIAGYTIRLHCLGLSQCIVGQMNVHLVWQTAEIIINKLSIQRPPCYFLLHLMSFFLQGKAWTHMPVCVHFVLFFAACTKMKHNGHPYVWSVIKLDLSWLFLSVGNY